MPEKSTKRRCVNLSWLLACPWEGRRRAQDAGLAAMLSGLALGGDKLQLLLARPPVWVCLPSSERRQAFPGVGRLPIDDGQSWAAEAVSGSVSIWGGKKKERKKKKSPHPSLKQPRLGPLCGQRGHWRGGRGQPETGSLFALARRLYGGLTLYPRLPWWRCFSGARRVPGRGGLAGWRPKPPAAGPSLGPFPCSMFMGRASVVPASVAVGVWPLATGCNLGWWQASGAEATSTP